MYDCPHPQHQHPTCVVGVVIPRKGMGTPTSEPRPCQHQSHAHSDLQGLRASESRESSMHGGALLGATVGAALLRVNVSAISPSTSEGERAAPRKKISLGTPAFGIGYIEEEEGVVLHCSLTFTIRSRLFAVWFSSTYASTLCCSL